MQSRIENPSLTMPSDRPSRAPCTVATGHLAKISPFLHLRSGLSQAVTQVTEHRCRRKAGERDTLDSVRTRVQGAEPSAPCWETDTLTDPPFPGRETRAQGP